MKTMILSFTLLTTLLASLFMMTPCMAQSDENHLDDQAPQNQMQDQMQDGPQDASREPDSVTLPEEEIPENQASEDAVPVEAE